MVLSEVLVEHTSLIPVINRLGIRLGLADKSVKEVCYAHDIDPDFLVMVINTFLNEEYFPEKKLLSLHTSQIVYYLTKTNLYYLRFQLPNIQRHLESFIAQSKSENNTLNLIGKFFASFKHELTERIDRDDNEWFPYCLKLAEKVKDHITDGMIEKHSVSATESEGDQLEELLSDLKSIMVKHLSGDYDDNLCYAVLFAISSLEKDIKQHNRIRYRILVPMVKTLERIEQHIDKCSER
jgi:regulator of cell morphogenesis and NO signaling